MKALFSVILACASLVSAVLLSGCKPSKEEPAPLSDEELAAKRIETVAKYFGIIYFGYEPPEDGLPMVEGYELYYSRLSINDALKSEPSGELKSLLEEFTREESLEKRTDIADKILCVTCGVGEVDEGEGLFSEKKLRIINTFCASHPAEFVPAPVTAEQAELLEQAYTLLVQHYCFSMICSLASDDLSYIGQCTDEYGRVYPGDNPYMGDFNFHMWSGAELGEMSELHFLDCCRALTYYGHLIDKSPRLIAEFRAYIEKQALFSLPINEKAFSCLKLVDRAIAEVEDMTRGANNIKYALGGEGSNELVGSAWYNLLVGGDGSDVLDGGTGYVGYLQGGRGDDIYIIRKNSGSAEIFDCEGKNILRFENVPLGNVLVSSVTDEGHENDVKISFYGEDGGAVIKDFKSSADYFGKFELEFGGVRIAADSEESPFMHIDDMSRVPDEVQAPL